MIRPTRSAETDGDDGIEHPQRSDSHAWKNVVQNGGMMFTAGMRWQADEARGGANGKVDVARGYDEHHADGEEGHDGHLTEKVGKVARLRRISSW